MELMFEVINALNALTAALTKLTEQTTLKELDTFEEIYTPPEMQEQAEPTQEEAEPPITRADVRAKLADLTRQGFSDAVKELLQKHGAERFSAVADEELPALMKEAEAVGT